VGVGSGFFAGDVVVVAVESGVGVVGFSVDFVAAAEGGYWCSGGLVSGVAFSDAVGEALVDDGAVVPPSGGLACCWCGECQWGEGGDSGHGHGEGAGLHKWCVLSEKGWCCPRSVGLVLMVAWGVGGV
jgi:hypothetical protein